jgi:RNA polymerase sigma factor (sigma-70 family)
MTTDTRQWTTKELADLLGITRAHARTSYPRGVGYLAADDIAQEAAIAILRAGPDGRGMWWAITRNRSVDMLRRAYRDHSEPVPEIADTAADPNPTPEQHLLARELQTVLRAALTTLTATQRRVIEMRYLDARTTPDIMAALGISAVQVRVTQHRALHALRTLLTERTRMTDDQRRTDTLTNRARRAEARYSQAWAALQRHTDATVDTPVAEAIAQLAWLHAEAVWGNEQLGLILRRQDAQLHERDEQLDREKALHAQTRDTNGLAITTLKGELADARAELDRARTENAHLIDTLAKRDEHAALAMDDHSEGRP